MSLRLRAAAPALPLLAVGLLALALASSAAHAHKPSDSYLSLGVQGARIDGRWDIALRDLEFALGLDADGDGGITWGEVRARHAEIASYALARLALKADGRDCPVTAGRQEVDEHSDGAYTVLRFTADCAFDHHVLQSAPCFPWSTPPRRVKPFSRSTS